MEIVAAADQWRAVRPGMVLFVLSAAGAWGGEALWPGAPGFVGLAASGLGSVVATLGIGLLLPPTRRAFAEALAGIVAILPERARTWALPGVQQ